MEERICYNCFSPLENTEAPCHHCGYDARESEGKYPLALPEGSILNGRYIVGRTLGQGGFGITYVAQEVQTGQRVAIKEFFPETMATRTERHSVMAFSGQRQENFAYGLQCFLTEAQTLAQFIGVENIVRVHSYFEENGTAYFVMDYVEGVSFQTYLKQRGGKIDWEEAKKILFPIMDALSIVHSKGIIHRDIAPDNIYITSDGTVKLLDFGAARYSLGDKSRSLDVVLKAGYAPMEQYTRRGRQGAYTDVYAIAATFYYAITGILPPEAVERVKDDLLMLPGSCGIKLPAEAEDALEKGLAVWPEERWQTMVAFRQALTDREESIGEPEEKIVYPKQPEIKKEPAREEKTEPRHVPERKEAPKRTEPKREEPKREEKTGRKPGKYFHLLGVAAAVFLLVGCLAFAGGNRDAKPQIKETTEAMALRSNIDIQEKTVSAGINHTVGIRSDGTVMAVGLSSLGCCEVSDWKNIVAVSAGGYHTAGLKENGTVIVAGSDRDGQSNVSGWKDIVAVSAGERHTVGLKTDGTVVAVGDNRYGQCDVSDWKDIVAISAGKVITVGLRSDGSVVAAGLNYYNQLDVSEWKDIVAVSAGRVHTVGLKSDGTVMAKGDNHYGQCDVSGWKDIVAVSAGESHTVGLKTDGTVVAVGSNEFGACAVSAWSDIIAVSAGLNYTIGLKSDGTAVAVGRNNGGKCDVSGWTDIRVPDGVLVNTTPLPLNSEECVLRSDTVASDDKNPRVLGSDYLRKDIVSITFLDTIHDAPEDSWDVSESGNGSVFAWVEPYGARYDLKIAGDGGVKAPADCSSLFENYTNVKSIQFNNAFYVTSDVTKMLSMFAGCNALTNLEVSGFDTSNVTDMNSMFFYCESLSKLDVSGFDTSKVTDMSLMFFQCSAKLTLGKWETGKVLYYDWFMELGRKYSGKPWQNLFK